MPWYVQVRHLWNFSLGFVVVVCVVVAAWKATLQWWHVALLLVGPALYDFGWHARVHHEQLLTGRIWGLFVLLGVLLAGIGVAVV